MTVAGKQGREPVRFHGEIITSRTTIPVAFDPPIFYLDSGDSTDNGTPQTHCRRLDRSSFQTLATLATGTTVSCEKLTIIRRELTRLRKYFLQAKRSRQRNRSGKILYPTPAGAASRRAITTCLTSKREREVVSSSESDCHSDVDRQSVFHDESRMNKSL